MNKDIVERIKEQIDYLVVDDKLHWLWTGTITNGYPTIKYHGKTNSVCRLVLIHIKHEILDLNDQANHTRDCRIKRCINPDHLYKGSHQDNMDDESVLCRICGGSKRPKRRCQLCKSRYNRKYYAGKT